MNADKIWIWNQIIQSLRQKLIDAIIIWKMATPFGKEGHNYGFNLLKNRHEPKHPNWPTYWRFFFILPPFLVSDFDKDKRKDKKKGQKDKRLKTSILNSWKCYRNCWGDEINHHKLKSKWVIIIYSNKDLTFCFIYLKNILNKIKIKGTISPRIFPKWRW